MERRRTKEALAARDAAVYRLTEACASLRIKSDVITRLEAERSGTPRKENEFASNSPSSRSSPEVEALSREVAELQVTRQTLLSQVKSLEEGFSQSQSQQLSPSVSTDSQRMQLSRNSSFSSAGDLNEIRLKLCENLVANGSTADIVKARNAILAGLPMPPGVPDDALTPIVIPTPFTLYEFLGNASGSLRNSLANYRAFQELTTSWCPDREEHGYTLSPAFKCTTNPRVATAHRWSAVDTMTRGGKPTECFYHKDGKWYYAGVYKQFRMDDLTVKEWEALSAETTQAIVKETLAGRKNTSPQNVYETSQLYAVGALKVACIGLQCIGFNAPMYRAILELEAEVEAVVEG